MTNNLSFKEFAYSLLIGAAVVLLGIIEPMAYYFGVIVIGFIGIAWGRSCAAVGAATCCLGLLFIDALSDNDYLLFLIIPFILGVVILISGFRRRMSYRGIAILLALLLAVTMYIGLCVPSIIRGDAPYAAVKDYFIQLDESFKASADYTGVDFAFYAENIDVLLYPMLIVIAEALAFFAVVICKRLCAHSRAEVRPMARLADWELPESLRIGIPVLAIGCIIISLTGYRGIEQIVAIVIALVAPLLFIEGFSAAVFLFTSGFRSVSAMRGGKLRNELAIFAMVLMAILLPAVFVVMGIVELYARRRPKLRRINEKIRKAFETAEREKLNVVRVDFEDGRGPQIIATRKQRDDSGIFFDDDIKKSVEEKVSDSKEKAAPDEMNKASDADGGEDGLGKEPNGEETDQQEDK